MKFQACSHGTKSLEKCPQGYPKNMNHGASYHQNSIPAKILFLLNISIEHLVSGAPRTRVSIQIWLRKVTWKRAQNKNNMFALGARKPFQMELPNRPEIHKISTPDQHMSILLLPRSPRGPPNKVIPQDAKMQAPGLPNHSFGHHK